MKAQIKVDMRWCRKERKKSGNGLVKKWKLCKKSWVEGGGGEGRGGEAGSSENRASDCGGGEGGRGEGGSDERADG